MKPVRVLHVLGELNYGGIEVMVMNLYRNIDRSRVQFDFMIHTPHRCVFEDEIKSLGGSVYRVPRFMGVNIGPYVKAWKIFFRQHPRYTVVHGHIGSSAAIYLDIAKKAGLYTIAHSHGTKNEFSLRGVMYAFFSFPTRFVADRFFACSVAAGEHRFGKKVVASPSFSVVQNAFDVRKFDYDEGKRDEVRQDLGIADAFVVGHVGRFTALKNHRFLLKVFASLVDTLPEAKLLLVGEGDERSAIEAQIRNLEIQDKVVLTGMRGDIENLLQAMDVFVFPSFAEGLGISLIEAQASGLPCIASTRVPQEARVSDLVTFLSLKESVSVWIQAIEHEASVKERRGRIEEVRESGYDIISSAQVMTRFYETVQ